MGRETLGDFFADRQALLAMVIIAGGLILGFVLERLTQMILGKVWLRRGWQGWDTVKRSLRGTVVLWCVIGAIYATIRLIEMEESTRDVFQEALLVLIIFTATLVMARITAGLVDLYITRTEGAMPSTTIMGNVIRIVILITGILVILTILDIPISPILTALGLSGLVVALALQDTLSNLFAGLQILASKKIKPGDYIQLDNGMEGWVTDITWRDSTIRMLSNNMVLVPNSRMASSAITNYSVEGRESSVLVDVGVSYGSDLEKVEEVTLDVARGVLREIVGGVPDYEPRVYYKEFSDFSINFTVVLRVVEYTERFLVIHEFIKRLHVRYAEEGIEIPFPIRTVRLEDQT